MTICDICKKGAAFTNSDEDALEMLEDFKDHKVGMKLDAEEITVVIKDSRVSVEQGIRDDCDIILAMTSSDMCGAIDNSYDLMELKEKGELLKGDIKDPNTPVHLMAIFPFMDAMVRHYEEDEAFKKDVDDAKASL